MSLRLLFCPVVDLAAFNEDSHSVPVGGCVSSETRNVKGKDIMGKSFLTWLRGGSTGEEVSSDGDLCCESPKCSTQPCEAKSSKPKPAQYSDLTDEDIEYIEAVRRGRVDVYMPMIKKAFYKAFPNSVVRDEVWRRDKNGSFTEFKLKRKNKSDAGWLGEGVYFFGSYEEAQDAYEYGWNLRAFFVNVTRPYNIDKILHDTIARANAKGVSHEVTEITSDFDGIFYNGDMREEWCVRDPRNVKLAEATYDDWGRIIPLSYRFKADNPDFRY